MPKREAPPKSHAEIFMYDHFPKLIGKLQDEFKISAPESSVEDETSDFHILYFDFFAEFYSMNIGHGVEINSKKWARAFLQPTLSSTVQILWEAVLTPRNTTYPGTESLILIVKRAALWIMTKETSHIDPWSYSFEDNDCSVHATYEQEAEIKNTVDQCLMNLISEDVGQNDAQRDREMMPPPPSYSLYDIMENMSDAAFEFNTLGKLDSTDNQYHTVFTQFLDWIKAKQLSINAAQVVGALTKATIPKNTDVFVDAVQISNARWTYAFKEQDLMSIARKLYAQMYRRDYPNGNYLQSPDDMCPIKRLALYRGSKWLWDVKKQKIFAQTSSFTSENVEHNVFPSFQEREEIDAGIRSCVEEIEGRKIDPLLNNIVSEQLYLHENLPTAGNWNDFGVRGVQNPEALFIPQENPNPAQVQQQNFNGLEPGCTGNNFGDENNSWPPLDHSVNVTQVDSLLVDNIISDYVHTQSTNTHLLELGSHFPDPAVNGGYEWNKTTTDLSIANSVPSTAITNCRLENADPTLTINPIQLSEVLQPQPSCSTSTATQLFHKEPVSVLWLDDTLPRSEKAFLDKGGINAAARILFTAQFTEEEIKNCRFGGRDNYPVFPEKKVSAILDVLEYFHKTHPGREKVPWSEEKKEKLTRYIFVDIANQERGKLKKK